MNKLKSLNYQRLAIAAITMVVIVFSIQLGFGQALPYKVTNVTFSKSDPTGTASTGAGWLNTTTGVVKVWQNNRYITATDSSIIAYIKGYAAAKGEKGDPGPMGPVGATGPKGDNGVCPSCPPPSGGGGGGVTIYNPYVVETTAEIQVGGTASNQTVSSSGASYSGITVTGSDLYDWANLQYGIYLANVKHKKLITAYQFNTNKSAQIDAACYSLVWDGGMTTKIVTQNNNAYSVIGRPAPKDNGDANLQIQATYNIQNIRISAQSNQIGFEPGPSYSSNYTEIRVENALTAIHLRFSLNTNVVSCDAGTCMNGFIADMGNWPGATNSNSQSNHTTFFHCHVYQGSPSGGNVGIGIYASSGCVVNECILEGGGFLRAIDFDFKMSSVVKEFRVINTHFETVYGNAGGANSAYIFVRGVGMVEIDGVFSQYPGVLVNASGLPAQLLVIVKNIQWLVPASDGKVFYNAGGTMWQLEDNNASEISDPSTIASRFSGTSVSQCTSKGCGTNKYTLKGFGY